MERSNNQNGFLQDIYLVTDQLKSYDVNRNADRSHKENRNTIPNQNIIYHSNYKKKVSSNTLKPSLPSSQIKSRAKTKPNNRIHAYNNNNNFNKNPMQEIQQFCLDIKNSKRQQSFNSNKKSNAPSTGLNETVLLNESEDNGENNLNHNFSVMENHQINTNYMSSMLLERRKRHLFTPQTSELLNADAYQKIKNYYGNKYKNRDQNSYRQQPFIINTNLDSSTEDYSSIISDILTDKSKFDDLFSNPKNNAINPLNDYSKTIKKIRKNGVDSLFMPPKKDSLIINEDEKEDVNEPYLHKTFSLESSEIEKKLENARASINVYKSNAMISNKNKYKLKNSEKEVEVGYTIHNTGHEQQPQQRQQQNRIKNNIVKPNETNSSSSNYDLDNDSHMNDMSSDSSSYTSSLSSDDENEYQEERNIPSGFVNPLHNNENKKIKSQMNIPNKNTLHQQLSHTRLKPQEQFQHNQKTSHINHSQDSHQHTKRKYDKKTRYKMKKHKREKEIKKQIEREVEREMAILKNNLILDTSNAIPSVESNKSSGIFQKIFNIPIFKHNNKNENPNLQNPNLQNPNLQNPNNINIQQPNVNFNPYNNFQFNTMRNYQEPNVKYGSTTTSSYTSSTSTSNTDSSTTSLTMSDITKFSGYSSETEDEKITKDSNDKLNNGMNIKNPNKNKIKKHVNNINDNINNNTNNNNNNNNNILPTNLTSPFDRINSMGSSINNFNSNMSGSFINLNYPNMNNNNIPTSPINGSYIYSPMNSNININPYLNNPYINANCFNNISRNPSINYSINTNSQETNNCYNIPPLPIILYKSRNSSYVSNVNKELPVCPSQKQMPSLESINFKPINQNRTSISNMSLYQSSVPDMISSNNGSSNNINSPPLQKNLQENSNDNNIKVSTILLDTSEEKEESNVKDENTIDNNKNESSLPKKSNNDEKKSSTKIKDKKGSNDNIKNKKGSSDNVKDKKSNMESNNTKTKSNKEEKNEISKSVNNKSIIINDDTEKDNETTKITEKNSFDDDDNDDKNSFDSSSESFGVSTTTKNINQKEVTVKSTTKAPPENTMNDISEEDFSDLSTESIEEDYANDKSKQEKQDMTETNKNSFDDDEISESESNSFDDDKKDTEIISKDQSMKNTEKNSFDDDDDESNDNSFDDSTNSDNNVKIIKPQPSQKQQEAEKDDWSSSESSWSSTNNQQTSTKQVTTNNYTNDNGVKVIRKVQDSPTTSIVSISEVGDFSEEEEESKNEVSVIKVNKGTKEEDENSFDDDEDESNWDSEDSENSVKKDEGPPKPKIIKNNLFDIVDNNKKINNNVKRQSVNEDEEIIENSFDDDDDESSWDSHKSEEDGGSKPKVTVIRNNLFNNDTNSIKKNRENEANETLSISSTQSVSAISEVLSSKSEEEDFDEELSEIKDVEEEEEEGEEEEEEEEQNSFDSSLSVSDSEEEEEGEDDDENESINEIEEDDDVEIIENSKRDESESEEEFEDEESENEKEEDQDINNIESISEKNSFDESSNEEEEEEEVKKMPEVTDDNKNKKKTSFSFLKFGKQKENDDDKTSSNSNLFKNIKNMSIGSLIGSNSSIITKYKGSVVKKNKNKIRYEVNDFDKTYDIINFLFELEDTQSNLLPTLDLTIFSHDKKCAAARIIIKYRETSVKELKSIDSNFMAEADEERIEDIIIRADQNKKKLTEYTTAECGNALMMLIRDVIITMNIYNKFIMNNNCDLKEKHITSLFNEKQKQLWNIIIGHFVNVIYLSDACIYDISNVIGWNLIPLSLLSLDDIGISDDVKNLLFKIGNNLQATSHLKNLLFSYHPVLIAYIFQSQKSDHYKMSEMLINFYYGFSTSLSNDKDNESKDDDGDNIEDCGYGFGENNVLYFVNTLIKYCFSTKQSIISKEFEMEILKYFLKYQSIEWINEVTLKIQEKLIQYNNKLDIENVTDKSQLKKNISNVKDVLKTLFSSILSLYDSTKTSLGFKYICQQIVMKHSAEYMLEILVNELLSEELYEWQQKKAQWTSTITRSTKQSLLLIIDLMKSFIKGKRNPNQEWYNEILTKERPSLIQQIEVQYGKDIKTAQQVQLDQGQRQGLPIISEDVALTSNTSNGLTSSEFSNQPNTKHAKEDMMFKKKELAIKQTVNYLKVNNQYLTKDIIAISSAKNSKQYPVWLFYKINKISLFVERSLRERISKIEN